MLNNASTYDSFSEACSNTTAAQGHDWIWPDRESFSAWGRCRARLTQSGEYLFPLTFVSAVGSDKSRAALILPGDECT